MSRASPRRDHRNAGHPSYPPDCDGASDYDADGDGSDGDAYGGTDCDDATSDTYLGATETWYDGVDSDCGGDSDYDADSDGYDSDGYGGTDCDDATASTSPAATEIECNAVDDDCDGTASCELDLSAADAKLVGETGDDLAGWSVSGAGDIDGDGRTDLLVGAPGEGTGGTAAGAAYLVLGPASGMIDLSAAVAKLVGENTGDNAGTTVSGVADTDGDGWVDLLVGATNYDDAGDSNAGAVYLVLGPASGTINLSAADAKLVGENAADTAGVSLSGAGDTDGDGRTDLLVGSFRAAGYLILGPASGTIDLSAADAKFVGESADDRAGNSVSGAGDTDGDGLTDLLIGAPGYDAPGTNAGAAYLILGPVSGTIDSSVADAIMAGYNTGDYTGLSLSGAGDVDGDGRTDLLVGAYGEETGGRDAGAAYLVLSPASGTIDLLTAADAMLVGEGADDWAGYAVSGAGDTDGDGRADLLIGAYKEDTGGSSAGAAYLVLGSPSGTIDLSAADAKLVGETADDRAGWRVSGAGDTDGDGRADLLVGAPGEDTSGLSAGAAYLILGASVP